MIGMIIFTNTSGGMITPNDGGPSIRFAWRDCDGIGPADIGHSTEVDFFLEVSNGVQRAICVRRKSLAT